MLVPSTIYEGHSKSCNPVEAKFLSGVFSPPTFAEAYEKSSRWLRKEICVSTCVRKPGNTSFRVATRQGKVRDFFFFFFFQGQGIVREFCEPSGKFENIGKCQRIIREF